MKKILLVSAFSLYSAIAALCTTITIVNSGSTFSPASITITLGDSVKFVLASIHNAVEVSQSTWNAGGTAPLPGFATPFGGGLVLPAQLTVGTHWYVCTNHASMGMKGTIIVQNAVGIAENQAQKTISVYPNPSSGQFTIYNLFPLSGGYDLGIYNIVGEKVYSDKITQGASYMAHADLLSGIYFLELKTSEGTEVKKIIIRH